jgi:hypothetical protein
MAMISSENTPEEVLTIVAQFLIGGMSQSDTESLGGDIQAYLDARKQTVDPNVLKAHEAALDDPGPRGG